MNWLVSIFHQTILVWLVAISLCTVVFFPAYWLVLFPVVWSKYCRGIEINRSWSNPWLYGYWLISAGVWMAAFTAAYIHLKRHKPRQPTNTECSSEFLLKLHRSSSILNCSSFQRTSQLQMKEQFASGDQLSRSEIGVSNPNIEPSMTVHLSRCSTFRPNNFFPEQFPHIRTGLDGQKIEGNAASFDNYFRSTPPPQTSPETSPFPSVPKSSMMDFNMELLLKEMTELKEMERELNLRSESPVAMDSRI